MLLSILAMFLSISCKEEIVEEEKGDSITKWIPAHTTFSQPLGEWERIQYCFKHEEEVRRRPLQRVYPAYYGGAQALPGDKTKYVIYLTDTSEVVKQDFVRLCDLVPENCVFRKCERSVNELHALIEEIFTSSSLSETGLIESCGVDEEAGMVRVTLAEDLDATQQARFMESVSRPELVRLVNYSEHIQEIMDFLDDVEENPEQQPSLPDTIDKVTSDETSTSQKITIQG